MSRSFFLTILAALTFGVAVIAHPPGQAFACSCLQPGPPMESAAQSEAVFAGTVANIAPQPAGQFGGGVLVTFDVQQVWKGPVGPQLTLSTSSSSASCGYEFVAGEEYIVYANAQEGMLATGLCSRTAPLANAAADVEALGPGEAPILGDAPPADEPAEPVAEPTAPAEPAASAPWLLITLGGAAVIGLAALGVVLARRRA